MVRFADFEKKYGTNEWTNLLAAWKTDFTAEDGRTWDEFYYSVSENKDQDEVTILAYQAECANQSDFVNPLDDYNLMEELILNKDNARKVRDALNKFLGEESTCVQCGSVVETGKKLCRECESIGN